MKLKLEVDFEYYSHWTFALLAATLTFSLGYFNLLSEKSDDSLRVGLMTVFFLILYMISERKYNKVYNELRNNLKDIKNKNNKENKMCKFLIKFRKIAFNENHFMNYTYSYFSGIMAALAIAYILGQNPFGYPWWSILIFILITFFAGLFSVTLIKSGFKKK